MRELFAMICVKIIQLKKSNFS